jgi:hypothetical protein
MKVFLIAILLIASQSVVAIPVSVESNNEVKGVLDGIGGSSSTTSSPIAGALNKVSDSGPMLILGGFQAVVTKFDPSLVQGLPGLAGIPQLPAGK